MRVSNDTPVAVKNNNNAIKVELLRRVFILIVATSKFTKWIIGKLMRRRVNLLAFNL